MKILVVEDKAVHRQSALDTLIGHEVTIISSFDEAMELMLEKRRWLATQAAEENPFPFEVVLTDMLMPMSRQALTFDAYKPNEQTPYGFIIALVAAHRGAKFVAVLTDANHHNDAMSAALDHLGPNYFMFGPYTNKINVLTINNAKTAFVHAPFTKSGAKDWARALNFLLVGEEAPTEES